MRTEVIKADTIDAAVQGILNELRASSNKENVIYFDGWDGLGASAVLQAIAKRLEVSHELSTRPSGPEFEKIIHIDCSKWESIRAVQRKIAEQLKLPIQVIDIFDKQDEEDDFNGLDQGSRGEIEQITREIYLAVQNHRFLIILENGSNEEIDILNFGLSLYGYINSKMLWTFQGRFRLRTKMIDNLKKSTATHVLLSATREKREPQELWSYLVRHEAAQVSCNKHGHDIIDPDIAAECVLYMLKQCCIGSHRVDYDWAIRTNNYWVCDGIIALTDIDKAWQVGDVLQHEVRLFGINNHDSNDKSTIMLSPHLARSTERMPYWNSTSTCGFVLSPSGLIPDNIFQHSDRLGVLKLSWCSFSFSSPPFLCCQSLRFLWLDHCKDLLTRSTTDHHHKGGYKEEEFVNCSTTSWACFQSLWVLDLRYTECDRILSAKIMDLMTELRELNVIGAKNWDMSHLSGRLRNICKLRIAKSTCFFNNNVFSDMESLELLDFSGNSIKQGMTSLSGAASNSSLKTVVIDGCDGLENISLRGCKEVKTVLLKGSLGNLEELDLSGTGVKTINLKEVKASSLPKRVILLGCDKLRAILWPQEVKRRDCPNVLIDTTSTLAPTDGGKEGHAHQHGNSSLKQQKEQKFKYGWRISLTDSRLLRSLSPISSYLSYSSLHIDICTTRTVNHSNAQGTSSQKLVQVQPHTSIMVNSKYINVLKDSPVAQTMSFDGPNINPEQNVINVIMLGQVNKLLDSPSATTNDLLLPGFICSRTTSLHMYDNSSITSIPELPQGSDWNSLKWCRVERCPKLHTVFTLPHGRFAGRFSQLNTFWASDLLTARYIWDRTMTATYEAFHLLRFLHLDYCPRLVHVLSLSLYMKPLYFLETLEIAWCGDLKEIFPLGPDLEDKGTYVIVGCLRCIYLHELPMLQCIFGRRVCVPRLETIKIRGCWSLRRLPVIGRNTKPPKVDCEKEWWDNLEWDGLDKYHHPSLYEPSHSLYHKKSQLPRGTLLR